MARPSPRDFAGAKRPKTYATAAATLENFDKKHRQTNPFAGAFAYQRLDFDTLGGVPLLLENVF